LLFITACALIGCAFSDKCETCSSKRKLNPKQDCIDFANEQDADFYQGEFLNYNYGPCNDPEEIVASVNPNITCIPLTGNKPLLKDQECEAGEYKHYHWTIQDYDVINDNEGSSIEFALTPCHGHPEIYIKPQILYAGIPMCQLFETEPGTEGEKTNTWPFPNNSTGSGKQGPDAKLFELEKKAKKNNVKYPGSFFSTQEWGHAGFITSDDGRPQPHRIRIPSISYGGWFVSVYCKTKSKFEVGLVAQKKKHADQDRYLSKDEDTLAMKIRRFGYNVDDKLLDANWGNLQKTSTAEDLLTTGGYNCKEVAGKEEEYLGCTQQHYIKNFGLSVFTDTNAMGAHHPEVVPKLLSNTTENTGDFCFDFTKEQCANQCCKWSAEGDKDIADFLKFGPFRLRDQIELNKGICRPATTKQSLCVTKKLQKHMTEDNKACTDQKDRDGGGCERGIQATMEVTFYTGETGGGIGDDKDTYPLFQLNYVEMNDCVSQMDKVGHQYCWPATFDRYVEEYDSKTTKKAGKEGAKWSHTCGDGSGKDEDGKPVCNPSHQARGQCFWDGTEDNSKVNQTTRETQWSQNADRCIMWTPCGVKQNGKPVMIEYKGADEKKDGETPELIQRTIPAETKTASFNVKDSIYIYGHVTDITREAIDSTHLERKYSRHVYKTEEETWRRYPARTWVRVEVPVYNDVTYFFNVLRKVAANSTVESYTGVSAVTSFYHKTQLYSDTTILIIAGVVVVALLFLLIPFIFTKRQIKAHLRKVYEKHKARGQAQPKQPEGEAGRGDNVVKFAAAEADTVVGHLVQDITTAEKQDPSMKKDASEPSKGGNSDK